MLHVFNPYDLQIDPYEPSRLDYQEIVDYCEARFSQSFPHFFCEGKRSKAEWKYHYLIQELHFCFSQIGVAAAIGRTINIPIFIRTLGYALYREHTKIVISPDLVAFLDGGLGCTWEEKQPGAFKLSWWFDSKAPSETGYLNQYTIEACLKAHRDLKPRSPASKSDTSPQPNNSAYHWHSGVHAESSNPCTRCRLYRGVALGAFDRLRDIRNSVHGCEMAYEGERSLAVRRVSGLNQLFEAALSKETEASSPDGAAGGAVYGSSPGKGRKKSRKGKKKSGKALSEEVSEQAREVLKHWVNKPDVKWTSGVDLTTDDLKQMVPLALRSCQLPQSGYDESLETGKMPGRDSPVHSPSEIEVEGVLFGEMSEDMTIRDLEPHEIPLAFSFPPLHYLNKDLLPPSAHSPPPSPLMDKGKRRDRETREEGIPYPGLPIPERVVSAAAAAINQPAPAPAPALQPNLGNDGDALMILDRDYGPGDIMDVVVLPDDGDGEDESFRPMMGSGIDCGPGDVMDVVVLSDDSEGVQSGGDEYYNMPDVDLHDENFTLDLLGI